MASDENEQMDGATLAAAIASDLEKGLIPFFVCTISFVDES